jgi:hypothetical protein
MSEAVFLLLLYDLMARTMTTLLLPFTSREEADLGTDGTIKTNL